VDYAMDHATATGTTPLFVACLRGHEQVVRVLLGAGASVDHATADGDTALYIACHDGHEQVVRVLLGAGATVDHANADGDTPLLVACHEGHEQVVRLLLGAGASVDLADADGDTPLYIACIHGHLGCVQQLSSYGAIRTFADGTTAEENASDSGHEILAAWLVVSRQWSTPLHHLTIISAARARMQLREGANLHVSAAVGAPTPVELAQRMHEAGEAAVGSASQLVLRAARPWSRAEHELFPRAARARALELLLVGHLLACEPRFEGVASAIIDVWVDHVMSFAVRRQ